MYVLWEEYNSNTIAMYNGRLMWRSCHTGSSGYLSSKTKPWTHRCLSWIDIYFIVQLLYPSLGNQECCFLNINRSFNKRKILVMYNRRLRWKSCLQ